ncbi:hypothetical protein ACFL1R_00585 [Candidatus Latescibacterota bacterium]
MKKKSFVLSLIIILMLTGMSLAGSHEKEKSLSESGKQLYFDLIEFDLMEPFPHELYLAEAPRAHIAPKPFTKEFYSSNGNKSKSRLMVIWRLVDHLDLDEDTGTKFFPIYLEYINTRNKLLGEQKELTESISEGADDESVPIKTLKENVVKLKKVEKSLRDERETLFKKSENILNERQHIKLIVFEDKLKRDLFSRFRSRRISSDSSERLDKSKESLEKAKQLLESEKRTK